MISYRELYRIFLFLAVLSLPALASAASVLNPIVPQNCNGSGGCQSVCDIAQLAQNIINLAIFLAIMASAIWFMITGYMFLTAHMRGETLGLVAAKKQLTHVFLGIVIIVGAWFFVDTLLSLITTGNLPSGMPWYQICTSVPSA